jgi:hypothetical protein
MEARRLEVVNEPRCPFCRTGLARPTPSTVKALDGVPGGICRGCGALYLVDQTGKNVGELMMQALTWAAERSKKDFSRMACGDDYEDAILNYNWRLHRSSGLSRGFADRGGKMYVLKIKQE